MHMLCFFDTDLLFEKIQTAHIITNLWIVNLRALP